MSLLIINYCKYVTFKKLPFREALHTYLWVLTKYILHKLKLPSLKYNQKITNVWQLSAKHKLYLHKL